jgi:hypothetical protein
MANMNKVPYTATIMLMDDAIDDICSGMDYNDYIANTHVQEIAKEYNIQNEVLKKIWSLADETIKQYNKIFEDIESITDGGYQNHKPCADYLFIKCATY